MDNIDKYIEEKLEELDLTQDQEYLEEALNNIYAVLEKEGLTKSSIRLMIQKKILKTTNNMYADLIKILKDDGYQGDLI
jgi:hypothetical protein